MEDTAEGIWEKETKKQEAHHKAMLDHMVALQKMMVETSNMMQHKS